MELQRTKDLHKTEKRSEERYPFLKTIRYACIPDIGEDFKGVTIDISKSGMSMYIFTTCCMREGLHVKVKDQLPVDSRTVTVRWVRQVDKDLYRAGLQFN